MNIRREINSMAGSFRVQTAINRGQVKAVILAGGKGDRLDAITRPNINKFALPKPSVPLGQIPLINFSLEALKAIGVSDVHVATCHLSEQIEKGVVQNRIYGLSMDSHREDPEKPLDTAGAVNYIFNTHQWAKDRDATVIVLSADIAHNIDLGPILENHLESRAAATIVLNDVPWSDVKRFGTVGLADMPRRKDYPDTESFEDAVGGYLTNHRGTAQTITGFKEKPSREEALSNWNNSSINLFNAGFLADISPLITPMNREDKKSPFRTISDFGKHILPALTGRTDHISPEYIHYQDFMEFATKVKQGLYPFRGYIWPEKNPWGKPSYWKDLGIPMALWEANIQDVLGGKLYTWLEPAHKMGIWWPTQYGWVGNHVNIGNNVKIAGSPLKGPTPHLPIGAIIGHYTTLGEGVTIENSILGDYVIVRQGANISNCLIFSGTPDSPTIIERGQRLTNSIVLGGKIPPDYIDMQGFDRAIAYYNPVIDPTRDLGGFVLANIKRENPGNE